MSILDKELEMATTVALDLGNPGLRSDGSVAPSGPGRPIMLEMTGITAGTLVITTGDTDAAADALVTVACPAGQFTRLALPTTCKRWIKATFADGRVDIILDSTQTNG